jgi:Trypsin-like peptidase domain
VREAVAQIQDPGTGSVASGFAFDSIRVITAAHAVGDNTEAIVKWPERGVTLRGRAHHLPGDADVAVILLDERCPVEPFPLARDVTPPKQFRSFGFRHSGDFVGLHAEGVISGRTRRSLSPDDATTEIFQLRTTSIDRGMSGAPLIIDGSAVAGMISGFWETASRRDADLAFAIPITLIEELLQHKPLSLGLNDIERLCLRSIAHLVLDRYEDGAWGKSFQPREKAFSSDARLEQQAHGGKRALSVTAWAACALSRVLPKRLSAYAGESTPFVMKSYIEKSGAFGFVHVQESATPEVEPVVSNLPNPRHTASAAKLVLEIEGLNTVVSRAVEFLVRKQAGEGGWSEMLDDEPNSLATAYVVDFLMNCQVLFPRLRPYYEPSTAARLVEELPSAIEDGLGWLARHQNSNGTWPYRPHSSLAEAAPAYAAHVVAFAPAVLTQRKIAMDRSFRFVNDELKRVGGVPDRTGGPASNARSLMFAYGLARLDDDDARKIARELAERAFERMEESDPDHRIATIADTFLLLYVHAAMAGSLTARLGAVAGEMMAGLKTATDGSAWVRRICAKEGVEIVHDV